MEIAVQAEHGVKLKESEKKDKFLDFKRGLKNIERESDDDTNRNWCT